MIKKAMLVRPVLRSKIGQEESVEHALFNSNVLALFGLGLFWIIIILFVDWWKEVFESNQQTLPLIN